MNFKTNAENVMPYTRPSLRYFGHIRDPVCDILAEYTMPTMKAARLMLSAPAPRTPHLSVMPKLLDTSPRRVIVVVLHHWPAMSSSLLAAAVADNAAFAASSATCAAAVEWRAATIACTAAASAAAAVAVAYSDADAASWRSVGGCDGARGAGIRGGLGW
jgi:hypothetical protein